MVACVAESLTLSLSGDCTIAIALEQDSILQQCASFDFGYMEPAPEDFQVSFNSPLLPPRIPFCSCIDTLGLHPATAWILDEMSFLIGSALNISAEPAPAETDKIRSTAMWIHDRIRKLSEDSPDTPQLPEVSPARASSSNQMASNQAGSLTPKPHSLLPRYPEFTASRRPSPAGSQSPQPASPEAPDPLYTAVRLVALLYAQAIADRRPFSSVCGPSDALAILAATWRVPLSRWRSVVGVFIFLLAAVVPTAQAQAADDGLIRATVHTRFAKSILQIGWMQMSLENWPVCRDMMDRTLRLQKCLRGSRETNEETNRS